MEAARKVWDYKQWNELYNSIKSQWRDEGIIYLIKYEGLSSLLVQNGSHRVRLLKELYGSDFEISCRISTVTSKSDVSVGKFNFTTKCYKKLYRSN